MARLLVINLLISLLWPALSGQYTLVHLFFGFALGFGVLTLGEPNYGRFALHLARFLAFAAYAIAESNVRLAWLVLRYLASTLRGHRQRPLHPGIVGIPLRLQADLDRTALATLITLTPGTISVELAQDPLGRDTLYVHAIHVTDPEAFRAEIAHRFEGRILHLRRLAEAVEQAQQEARP